MRTRQRLLALQTFVYETVCKGRQMKCSAENGNMTVVARQEPQVYLGWYPKRPDETGLFRDDPISVTPGILISPLPSNVKAKEEQRFDRYNNIHRPKELGQFLNVSILFSVFEDGVRLPGFLAEDGGKFPKIKMGRILEGTEEGLFTLLDWIDDLKDAFVAVKAIPNSDLIVNDVEFTYGPYTDGTGFVADKRPIYYGFINASFECYSENKANTSIDEFLI